MFTGIIEEVGRLRRVQTQGQAMVLTIEAAVVLSDVKLGDSISVNGVCLTVVAFDGSSFSVDVMPETFRKTSLKLLSVGSRVNLERAMPVNGRFGGHLVQGHVDVMGRITSRRPEENAVVFRIEPLTSGLMKYMLPNGSITIDGISLTLVKVEESSVTVSIIPHTLAQTVLQEKQAGDIVNLECDLLGKYVERLLRFRTDGAGDEGEAAARGSSSSPGGITEAFLARNGFL